MAYAKKLKISLWVRFRALPAGSPNLTLIYAVMEYLPNGSLDSYAQKTATKGWDSIILYRVVLGVARGMAHLAGEGIVHRDLAARNILLSDGFDPKISDFGMSRMVGGEQGQGQTASDVGPIKWMPPESIATKSYSEKSDVWSYGVLLYEATTGLLPFGNDDLLQVAVEVRDSSRTVLTGAPTEILQKIPEYIMEIMKDCFQKDATLRPSFRDIVALLEAHAPEGYTETETNHEHQSKSSKKQKKGKKSRADDAETVEMQPRGDAQYSSLPSSV
jgi:Janus kinase 2